VADREQKNAETGSVLLAAARELISENPNFSLKTLLIKTGVSRARFRHCFAGKEQLLAALAGEGIKGLSEILDAAQPAARTMGVAVGSDVAPISAAAPATDAWLERRLRVFERALAGLEKRQEKTEQDFTLQLALVKENLTALAQPETIAAPIPTPRAAILERKPIALKPVEFVPADSKPVETPVEPKPVEMPAAIVAAAEPAPLQIEGPELSPATQAFVEEIAAVAAPVDEREIADFIAHARRVAQNAALAETAPPKRLINMRWLAWSGAVLMVLLCCAGVLLVSGAFGGPAGAQPVIVDAGVTHRHIAQNGLAHVIALADSGDATAETVLAMAYLKGRGVPGDDEAARRWSLAAASQGQPVAQYLLGTLYLEGNKDESEAARWFLAAAAQGNVKAMHNLAIAFAEGLGVEKDPAEAVKWFVRAAAAGYRDSEFDLAVLYERGLGVPQSARAALKWYLVAAAQGDAPSAARAAFLKEQMDPMEIKLAVTEAQAFAPQPAGGFANKTPEL
jgi:TPR repeat protein